MKIWALIPGSGENSPAPSLAAAFSAFVAGTMPGTPSVPGAPPARHAALRR